MNAHGEWILRIPTVCEYCPLPESHKPYLLLMLIRSILVVFSIDLTITRSFGFIGELANLSGLKLRMALRILLAMGGRARISMERQFKVASISTASLIC